jgi:hypothetical protein
MRHLGLFGRQSGLELFSDAVSLSQDSKWGISRQELLPFFLAP